MRKIQEMSDSLNEDTKQRAFSALHQTMISGTSLERSSSVALQRWEPEPMIVCHPDNPSLTLNSRKDVAQTFAHSLQHLGGDPDYRPPTSFVSKVFLAHANCTPFFSPKHLDFVTEKNSFFCHLENTVFQTLPKNAFFISFAHFSLFLGGSNNHSLVQNQRVYRSFSPQKNFVS